MLIKPSFHKKQKSVMDKAFLSRLPSPRNEKAVEKKAAAVSVVKPPLTAKNSTKDLTERKFDFNRGPNSRPNR